MSKQKSPIYTITRCTIADGPALARNNMSAFWQDPNWVLVWKHTTLERLIPEVAKRVPRMLLNDRVCYRHQKMIDDEGRPVGYARWILPPSAAGKGDALVPSGDVSAGEAVARSESAKEVGGMWEAWKEAIVPAVGKEEEAEIRTIAEAADWHPGSDTDALDPPVTKIKAEILARKPWMRLDFLAVHPDHQREGIATALVQSGMREAEKLGLDIFILAFRMGVNVYKRLGFRVEQELMQDDSMYGGDGIYGVWFMVYEQEERGENKA